MHPVAGPPDPRLTVSDAYDAIAGRYDHDIRGDEWMRAALHRHFLRVFSPGDRVLDVACGTGTDARALAARGIAVVGVDASAGMIAAFRTATRGNPLIESHVLRVEDLGRLVGPFDGAVSSFAGLNTSSLDEASRQLARLIRPGGRAVLHMLNRFSLWEWLGALRHGRWLRPASSRSFTIGGIRVDHRLYSAREAYEPFAPYFVLRQAYALGTLRPPHTVRKLPRSLTRGLAWLDVRAGTLPGLRNAGRFFVLDLERRLS